MVGKDWISTAKGKTERIESTDPADSVGAEAMVWLLSLYVIMSIVVSVSAAFHIGIAAGIYAVLTIALALIAGAGLKATLFWGNTVHKIGGPVVTALLVILAYWLSSGFSVGLFSYRFTGAEWGAIGFVIAFLWANQRIAATMLSNLRA